jgi:xylosylprotein 4-beta-galactosyltransferase
VKYASYAGCDYFALHDIDLLPDNPNLDYGKPVKTGVYHVSRPGLHPLYRHSKFLGGIITITKEAFISVNGFSNDYWGWGREDDDFRERIRSKKIKVDRPPLLSTGTKKTFINLHLKEDIRDKSKTEEQNRYAKQHFPERGFNDTSLSETCFWEKSLAGIVYFVVDAKLSCDAKTTPWCLPLST